MGEPHVAAAHLYDWQVISSWDAHQLPDSRVQSSMAVASAGKGLTAAPFC